MAGLIGFPRDVLTNVGDEEAEARSDSFVGSKAGDERDAEGVKLCWCPPGRFRMGSPPDEPERRPGEAQVEVTLSRGFWIGKLPGQPWGLRDVHGNVFEWCRDWYHPMLPGGTDPDLSSIKAASRVRRRGCWADEGPCRSAFRLRFEPERRHDHIGFRIVAISL